MSFEAKELGKEWGGKKGARVGLEREQFIIAWLARWRYSTAEVLALVVSRYNKASTKAVNDKLAKMIRHKLVRKVDCIFVNKGYVYQLTQLGVEYYRRLSKRKIPPRLDASKIRSNSNTPHDLGVQMYVAHKFRQGNISSFMTHSELQWEYGGESCTVPDALIVCEEKGRTAIEFEPTQKSEKRMRGKYQDNRHDDSKRNKLPEGVFDKHHHALDGWDNDTSKFWGFVEYVMFGEEASKSYQRWLTSYYRLRFKSKNDAQSWIDSYSFNVTAGKNIEKYIYFSTTPSDNISSIL